MARKADDTESSKVQTIERIPSGIPGLDKLIKGGFIKGSSILVSGAAGTGKTIFCTQFIMEGLKRGENCMFMTLEEKPNDIINDVKEFGWDLQKYIDEKKLLLEFGDVFQITDIAGPLLDKIQQHNIQRVAIDSTAVFGLCFDKPAEIRKQLFKLLTGLKGIGVTSVLTSELPEQPKFLSKFGVEEFIVDGVIVIRYNEYTTTTPISLNIRKMRRTSHSRMSVPVEITKEGIVLK